MAVEDIDKGFGLNSDPVPTPRDRNADAANLRPAPIAPPPLAQSQPTQSSPSQGSTNVPVAAPTSQPVSAPIPSVDEILAQYKQPEMVGRDIVSDYPIVRRHVEGSDFSIAGRVASGVRQGISNLSVTGFELGEVGVDRMAEIVAQQMQEARGNPVSEDSMRGYVKLDEINRRPGNFIEKVDDVIGVFIEHPGTLGGTVLESIPQFLPAWGLGALGGSVGGPIGTISGFGVGTFANEFGARMLEYMSSKRGVDLTNKEQLRSAFSNSEWLSEARDYALNKAASITAIDMLTGGAAGKIARAVSKFGGRLNGGAAGVATEMLGGAGGEALATLSVGEKLSENVSDIVLEGVAEGPIGLVQLGTLARSAGRKTIPTDSEVIVDATARDVESRTSLPDISAETLALQGREIDTRREGQAFIQPPARETSPSQREIRNGRMFVANEVSLEEDTTRNMATATNVVGKLIKRMRISEGVDVVVGNNVARRGALETYVPPKDGERAQIRINSNTLGSIEKEAVFDLVMHGFGHHIAYTKLRKLNDLELSTLYAAYRRDVGVASGKSFLTEEEMRGLMSKVGATADQGVIVSQPHRFLSFEEWFANNVARWSTTNRKPVTLTGKISKRVAQDIINTTREFRKRLPEKKDWRPDQDVAVWLNRQFDGSITGDYSQHLPEAPPIEYARLSRVFDEAGVADHPIVKDTKENYLLFHRFFGWGLSILQWAELNPNITGLRRYAERIKLADARQSSLMGDAQTRINEWMQLGGRFGQVGGGTQGSKLGDFLFALTSQEYRTEEERKQGVSRNPTDEELQELFETYGLEKPAQDMYFKIKQDFITALDRLIGVTAKTAGATREVQLLAERGELDQAIKLAAQDPAQINAMARLQSLKSMREQLLSKPYFPITRFGKYYVTVRKGGKTGPVVHHQHFEFENDQQRAFSRLEKEHKDDYVFFGKFTEPQRAVMGLPSGMLDSLAEQLELSQEQRDALEQFKFSLSPNGSIEKRFIHRKKDLVEGYSRDAISSYADYMFHHSKHVTRLEFRDELRADIAAVKGERVTNANRIAELVDLMNRHLDFFLNPTRDFAGLRAAAALWHLGFSPAAAFLNTFQLPMATAPYLGDKFGIGKSFDAMKQAAFDYRMLYQKNINKATDTEMQALAFAIEEGVISESQAAELAAMSEGNNLLESTFRGGGEGAAWLKKVRVRTAQFSKAAMFLFQTTEKYNRAVTFRAAWNLAQNDPTNEWVKELKAKNTLQFDRLINEKEMNEVDALAYLAGKEAVEATQYLYSDFARPEVLRSKLGTVFMFYMFTQQTMFMLWNNKGMIPQYLVTMAALAGVMGIPGAEDVEEIVKALSRQVGPEVSLELELRRAVMAWTDDDFVTDLIIHGSSKRGFGLHALAKMAGVSIVPEIDMSRAIGMGQVLPISPLVFNRTDISFDKRLALAVEEGVGPAFGIGLGMAEALADGSNPIGDPQRWVRAMPRQMRALGNAIQFATYGRQYDRSYATVASFDPTDPSDIAELAAAAMGFQPTRVGKTWDRVIAESEVRGYWEGRRRALLEQYAFNFFIRNNDKSGRESVLSSIRQYNRALPRELRNKAITRDTLSRSLNNRRRNIQGRERGIDERSPALSRAFQELFPNSTPTSVPASSLFRRRVERELQ